MNIRKIKWVVLFLVGLLVINIVFVMRGEAVANHEVTPQVVDAIPSDAIRLRILANSDSIADQTLKRKVRDAVAKDIAKWVADYDNKAEAAAVIEAKIPEIKQVIQSIMAERNQQQAFTVELTPTEFPVKLYGNQFYAAGTYDALRIVLGEGAGANWWCVLFPPLCFLDFDTSSTATTELVDYEEPEAAEVEVKFFLFEWFQNIWA